MKPGIFLAAAMVISGAQTARADPVDLTGDLISVSLIVSTGARPPRNFGTFTVPDVYHVDGFPYMGDADHGFRRDRHDPA